MEPDIQITSKTGITRITYRGTARSDLTTEMIREAALIGFRNQCKLLLIDISESSNPDYQVTAMQHAEQASALGIDPEFRIAFLSTGEDQRLPLFEELAIKHGLQGKSFTDESEALAWLTKNS